MIQKDTISISKNLFGTASTTISNTGTTTIQGIYFSERISDKDNYTRLYCDKYIIATDWGNQASYLDLNYVCGQELFVFHQGYDWAGVVVNYLPYDIKTAPATSTPIEFFYGGISYGDILLSFFVLLLLTGSFFSGLLNRIWGIKKRRNLYNDYEYIPISEKNDR